MPMYVYYQAAAEHGPQLQLQVGRMQAGLGVAASLCRRPASEAGMHTWMEVYPAAGAEFANRLARAAQQAGLAQWIHGERHVEYFVEIASCA